MSCPWEGECELESQEFQRIWDRPLALTFPRPLFPFPEAMEIYIQNHEKLRRWAYLEKVIMAHAPEGREDLSREWYCHLLPFLEPVWRAIARLEEENRRCFEAEWIEDVPDEVHDPYEYPDELNLFNHRFQTLRCCIRVE